MTAAAVRVRVVLLAGAALLCAALLTAGGPAPVASVAGPGPRSGAPATGSGGAAGTTQAAQGAAALGAWASSASTARAGRGNPRAYSFIGRSGRKVARWNPCRRIGYRVNARLGRAGALRDAKRAVRRIARASGLRFAYRGRTRIVPGGRGDRSYPRNTQLVIAWARPKQSDHLGQSGVAGMGGVSWTSAVNRKDEPDLMITRGYAVLNANLRLGKGFGGGVHNGYYGTRGQLLMHEIGHAVGMGHADQDRWQILYPTMTSKRAVWGAGDRNGLRRLGARRGCLSATSYQSSVSAAQSMPHAQHGAARLS